jgi:uncharacterized protein YdaU (DUF1376 family)
MAKARDPLPFLPLYVDDWLNSESVSLMSFEAQGVYIRLLCYQWRNGSIPSDLSKVARLAGIPIADLGRVWDEVGPMFWEVDNTLANPRLANERTRQMERYEAKSQGGKQGNAKRWGNTSDTESDTDTHSDQYANPKEKEKEKESIPNGIPASAKHPSLEECQAYAKERFNLNAEFGRRFWETYENTGWIRGDGKPVSNWKNTMGSWYDKRTEPELAKYRLQSQGKSVSFQEAREAAR